MALFKVLALLLCAACDISAQRTGATGFTGVSGPPGYQGYTGGTGPQGGTGRPGVPGGQGEPGLMGATGQTGREGPKGKTGAVGFGQAGVEGRPGSQGRLGVPGPVILRGPNGAQQTLPRAKAGPVGFPGYPGPVGSAGPAGPAGPPGPPATGFNQQGPPNLSPNNCQSTAALTDRTQMSHPDTDGTLIYSMVAVAVSIVCMTSMVVVIFFSLSNLKALRRDINLGRKEVYANDYIKTDGKMLDPKHEYEDLKESTARL